MAKKIEVKEYTKPKYMKGFEFTVLKEIPSTDSYVVEVRGKNFHGVKLVSKAEVLGKKVIHWDAQDLEKERISSLRGGNDVVTARKDNNTH